jgi:hypothetical protein
VTKITLPQKNQPEISESMPKGFLHIACSLLILLNGMSYSIIQAHFFIQQDQIAAIFCINQDKPEMKCDGKCELSKRLSEAQEKEKSPESITIKELNLVFTIPNFEEFESSDFSISQLESFPSSHSPEGDIRGFDFFHPPQA